MLNWQNALAATRLPHDAKQIVEGESSAGSGYAGLAHLLRQYPKLDALSSSNDQMAAGRDRCHTVQSL